ncbi:MAG: hypothetical protein L6R28_12265 [Planctomycetes bacterium]|nr:hypothetical protein [Planctomycetota bacterium]
MARRAVEEEEEDVLEDEEPQGGEEEEYVVCPVCQGRGRGCRFCDGFGDVHPDDVGPILAAAKKEGSAKTLLMVGGGTLFLGLLIVIFILVSSAKPAGDDSGSGGGEGGAAAGGSGAGGAPIDEGTKQDPADEEARGNLVAMKLMMKAKQYQKAIEIGEKALATAKDPNLKKNIQKELDKARQAGGG